MVGSAGAKRPELLTVKLNVRDSLDGFGSFGERWGKSNLLVGVGFLRGRFISACNIL